MGVRLTSPTVVFAIAVIGLCLLISADHSQAGFVDTRASAEALLHSASQPFTGSPTSTSQATDVPSIAGLWSGSATDSSGPGELSWDITQEDARVAGRFTAKDPSSGVALSGTIIGQLSSSTLTFTMTVERGTLPRPYQSCEIALKGNAEVSGVEIKGTYEGQSCGRPVRNGQLTLLRN